MRRGSLRCMELNDVSENDLSAKNNDASCANSDGWCLEVKRVKLKCLLCVKYSRNVDINEIDSLNRFND